MKIKDMQQMKGLTVVVVIVCVLMVLIGVLYASGVFQMMAGCGSCAQIGNLCKCPQKISMQSDDMI